MELTQAEIDERTAILRRFRSLLEQQRDKFREYLRVLESQSKMIQEENTQSLLAHTELEQQIASHIISLQKVIKPMELMYQERISKGRGDVADIPVLQADLERLQRQVLERNQSNRNLLKLHMSQIKERMSTVTNPYRHNKSVYAQSAQVASMVNISI
ncbi:MAG: flagellar biosynthesis protein FlgN [Spirochaetia bacterium]|nr:flagellar biosynthesis protein FlgN [Spirochaetia bacterium]